MILVILQQPLLYIMVIDYWANKLYSYIIEKHMIHTQSKLENLSQQMQLASHHLGFSVKWD